MCISHIWCFKAPFRPFPQYGKVCGEIGVVGTYGNTGGRASVHGLQTLLMLHNTWVTCLSIVCCFMCEGKKAESSSRVGFVCLPTCYSWLSRLDIQKGLSIYFSACLKTQTYACTHGVGGMKIATELFWGIKMVQGLSQLVLTCSHLMLQTCISHDF